MSLGKKRGDQEKKEEKQSHDSSVTYTVVQTHGHRKNTDARQTEEEKNSLAKRCLVVEAIVCPIRGSRGLDSSCVQKSANKSESRR